MSKTIRSNKTEIAAAAEIVAPAATRIGQWAAEVAAAHQGRADGKATRSGDRYVRLHDVFAAHVGKTITFGQINAATGDARGEKARDVRARWIAGMDRLYTIMGGVLPYTPRVGETGITIIDQPSAGGRQSRA